MSDDARPSNEAVSAALERLNTPPPEPDPPPAEAEVRHLRPVEDEKPPIVLFNTETGEQIGTLAELEAAHEAEYSALQVKYRGALAEITKLKSNKEAEARRHESWAMAESLHDWYAIATGHPGRKFGAEEFYQALPRLGGGPYPFLQAIAGMAFDPKRSSKPQRNGKFTLYDSWEHVTRNVGNFDSYRGRAPFPGDEHGWKRWLVAHIEAQLEERARDVLATEAHVSRLAQKLTRGNRSDTLDP